MRKKYLSALLFGALLFASAGTFTSCKDYDDDIDGLRTEVAANAEAIKALQDLVGDGKFVKSVSNDGNTITFTFTDGTTQPITLTDEKGSVVTVEDGVLCIDGEPTEIKVAGSGEAGEEHKDQIIIENNMWSVLQEDGTYKSTGIPVSGVSVSGSESDGYTFRIYASDGSYQDVKLPSVASAMKDFELMGFVTDATLSDDKNISLGQLEKNDEAGLEVTYAYVAGFPIKEKDASNQWVDSEEDSPASWSAQKDVTKKQVLTTLAADGYNLVARVAPADLDLSALEFTLQDSKGNVLPIGVNKSTKFNELLTRGAESSLHLIPLDVTSATYDDEQDYQDLFPTDKRVYSLANGTNTRSTYGEFTVTAEKADNLVPAVVTGIKPEGTTTDNNAGTGAEDDPFIVDLNTPTIFLFNNDGEKTNDNSNQVYDYYVVVADKQAGEEFGFSTNIKDGTITLTKSIDLVTKTGLELYVYALRIDGTIYKQSVWVKPSSIMASAVTLKAGEQNIVPLFDKDGVVTNDGYAQFTVSLDEMFANMSDTDKQRWMSSVTGANAGFSISALKEAGKDFAGLDVTDENDIDIAFLDKDGEPCNNTKATSLLLTVKYKNTTNDPETAILTPYKEYSMNVSFLHKEDNGTSVLNTVGLTLTPTLPTLSDYMTKRSVYWDGNVLMAYFDDPTSGETGKLESGKYLESKFDMNHGYTKLGWKDAKAKDPYCILDVNFSLDKDQKIGDVSVLDEEKGIYKDIQNTGCNVNEINLGTVEKAGKKPFGYGEELNVLVGATYLGVYDYSKFETTKAQLADAAYKIKVQSALEAGTIAPANGASITLTPSGASQMMEITADDVKATAYNLDAPYNIFKDVVTKDGKVVWGYNYINAVEFATPDELIYQVVDKDGNAGKSAAAIDPATTKKDDVYVITDESYVSLKGRNTTDGTETTIKVTVTDWYGYTKTVDLPVIIKKANTGDSAE